MNPLRPQHGELVEHGGNIYRPLKVGEMRQAGDVYFWDGTMREEFFDGTAQTSCDIGIEQSYRLVEASIETSPTRNPVDSDEPGFGKVSEKLPVDDSELPQLIPGTCIYL